MPLSQNCRSANPEGSIVSLGEILVDLIPAQDSMRLEDAGLVVKTASGSAAIFACAAANLGGESVFLGKLGTDPLSRMAAQIIESYGVDLSHAVRSSQGQIGLAFIEYSDSGRNYQYYRKESVGSMYGPEDVDEQSIRIAFALHFPGMLLDLNTNMYGACERAVRIAKESGVLFSFDPNLRKEINDPLSREKMLRMLSLCDVTTPTLDEGRAMTGCQTPGDVLRSLHAMGPKVIALTRDKDGAILSAGGEVVIAEGIEIGSVDPTGAGDAFAAALIVSIQRGMDLEEAARFCNSAGTLVTTKRGAIGLSLPDAVQTGELAADSRFVSRRVRLEQVE